MLVIKQKSQRRKSGKSLYLIAFGLIVIPALFLYGQYLYGLKHVRVAARSGDTTSAVVSKADKPEPSGSSLKPDDQPAPEKTDEQAAEKTAPGGFVSSLMSVFSPSVHAMERPPALPPAPAVTKLAATPPAEIRSASRGVLAPMTPAQKRLKLAQDGFSDAMNQANFYPATYGFKPGENPMAAGLGDPVPVCKIEQPGGMSLGNQPLNSLLKPADEWLYPVFLAGHVRFMVSVRCVQGGYVLGRGSRALGMSYDKIISRWPASQGFHPQIVVLPNRPFYYFTIPELPDQNLTDTVRMLDYSPTVTPASVILVGLR